MCMCVFPALRVISNQIIFSRRRERLSSPMDRSGMHLVVAAARARAKCNREIIILEATGGLWNTDGQWNAYLSDRLLSLFMYTRYYVALRDW